MGKFSVDKGKRFERQLVRLFADAAPLAQVRRGFQWRNGSDAPDVDIPGFWLEAKVGAKTNHRKALHQAAIAARGTTKWPLAVCKDDREAPTVHMHLSDFLAMYTQWLPGKAV